MVCIEKLIDNKAYILLVAAEVKIPLLALVAEAGNVTREVQTRALFGEDRRGIGGWTGHVEVADLLGATREVAQGNELDGSGSGHCGGLVLVCSGERWCERAEGRLWD